MKRTSTRSLLVLLLLFLAAPVRAADHVVIAVIDGLRSTEGFDDRDYRFIPRMGYELAPEGALARTCDNMGLTVTIPGHSAIASGRYQNLANDGSQRSLFPLLWEYYREAEGAPEEDAVLVTTKTKIKILSYSNWYGYGPPDSARVLGPTYSDIGTVNLFLADMAAHHPKIAMLNLGEVDVAAHTGDWNRYTRAIVVADSMIALLWQRIQSDPIYSGRTDLIISGDHGRHADGYGSWSNHGDDCPGCRRIPLLALGPDFPAGIVSWTPCEQIDLCRTVGSILGIPTTLALGRILTELMGEPAAVVPPAPSADLLVQTKGSRVQFRIGSGHGPVDLRLFDLWGRGVAHGRLSPGGVWSWKSSSSGVFFYRVEGAESTRVGRVVLLR